ncbi:MAG: S9 family peptidase [Bacteroidetes bacterium]|nr:S9 family peptidase [Bacteroidota bacterium]MBL6944276.1 S9 family peptidase [Bacteroidales bacterium]
MTKKSIMQLRPLLIFVLLSINISGIFAQEKIPLNHSVYNDWKSISNQSMSNDGNWLTYEINPQEGDGQLYLFNTQNRNYDSVQRGYKPVLSSKSNMLLFNIKPQFDTVRVAKLKKVKKDELHADSLGIWITETTDIRKFAELKSIKIPEKESDWLAFLLKEGEVKKDTTKSDTTKITKRSKKDKKKKGDLLVIMNPITGDSVSYKNVTQYSISKNGQLCAFVSIAGDSIDSVRVAYYFTNEKKYNLIFSKPGFSENICVDEAGKQLSFTYSTDTIKEKAFGLFYYGVTKNELRLVSGTNFSNLVPDWSVSKNGKLYFNESGSELYFGTAPKPEPVSKDTLTEDEKVSVDIWNWKDVHLQPQQLKQLDKEKKRSYTAVYVPKKDKLVQLEDEKIKSVTINVKSKGKYSIGFDDKPYQRKASWEASHYRDVYLINRESGDKSLVLPEIASSVLFSPEQNFIVWYNIVDSSWNSYNINTGKSINLTANMEVKFCNELNDMPNEPYPYGIAGWTKTGSPVIYNRYDLWLFDASGKKLPVNLTKSQGRKNKIVFRYIKLDRELQYLPDHIMLSAFNNINKDAGYYSLNISEGSPPIKMIMDSFEFGSLSKAKHANELIWTKQSFNLFPDLYLSNSDFQEIAKITDANPQQDEYLLGKVELVNWISFNGDSLQGLLYTPENIDPNKKYPMLVYFYERYSDRLHRNYSPKPIRSVINFSYYVSNGYVIFVPDIVYTNGYPGPSAFDCIVSGTHAMCDNYNYIDRDRLGIQGQSWGGYQTAYIITQTNMYRAAMAGATVSNMTSAYGGIRWESGRSRAFQYEQTQSRIGGNLWDKLPLYMLNSPLFSADRIQTPLLMMHNDADGAVPWYQSIELFNALRRLDKPSWLLVYNGAPHNLKRRADMKDLTIRMQQFFDYYLKDAPEPVWMKDGIPAIKKGKTFGFEVEK